LFVWAIFSWATQNEVFTCLAGQHGIVCSPCSVWFMLVLAWPDLQARCDKSNKLVKWTKNAWLKAGLEAKLVTLCHKLRQYNVSSDSLPWLRNYSNNFVIQLSYKGMNKFRILVVTTSSLASFRSSLQFPLFQWLLVSKFGNIITDLRATLFLKLFIWYCDHVECGYNTIWMGQGASQIFLDIGIAPEFLKPDSIQLLLLCANNKCTSVQIVCCWKKL
jgi:hypothetical protein